ncbi:MAG: branched-chain amino acid transporter2C amino acid-binding protein, partial [bacterium]|nr:branched-chain amino acid transporter2C amino acid-binding protein [bacterium]
GGSAGGGGGGGGGAKDMAMAGPQDMAMMSIPDLAKPADMVVVSSCAHDECTIGTKLTKGCSACVSAVCATGADPYCCSTTWDTTCVNTDVNKYCTTKTCP